jgi:2-hydroxycyclohexanecarboxyl-CoA dehydrogenase
MDMKPRMAGKIALVTGAGGGIGGATGELFCMHGAQVLLVDRDAAALEQMAAAIRERLPGAAVDVCATDVADPGQASNAVKRAVATFGALNVLVNCAAVRNLDPIASADRAEWEKVLSINLTGAVNFCRAALEDLRKQRGSSVVIVSSTYAVVGRRGFGAYDATKAGLLSLMRTLAWEEAEHGIRVNAVCPGGTLTPFTIGLGKARGLTEEQLRGEVKPNTLLRRWAEAQEVAYPILWLASDEASFVTGATLMVDGGTSIM